MTSSHLWPTVMFLVPVQVWCQAFPCTQNGWIWRPGERLKGFLKVLNHARNFHVSRNLGSILCKPTVKYFLFLLAFSVGQMIKPIVPGLLILPFVKNPVNCVWTLIYCLKKSGCIMIICFQTFCNVVTFYTAYVILTFSIFSDKNLQLAYNLLY